MLSAVSSMQYYVCFISDNMKREPALSTRLLDVMQSMGVLAWNAVLLMQKGDEAKISLFHIHTHTV